MDRRLNRYLKEMATVRKRERRMTLMSAKVKAVRREGQGRVMAKVKVVKREGQGRVMSAKVKAVKREGQVMPESNSVITLSPSPMATRSFRGQTATDGSYHFQR